MKKLMIASACFTLAACGGSDSGGLTVDGQIDTNTMDTNIILVEQGTSAKDMATVPVALALGGSMSSYSQTGPAPRAQSCMSMNTSSETSGSFIFNNCYTQGFTIDGSVGFNLLSGDVETDNYALRIDYSSFSISVNGNDGSNLSFSIDGDIETTSSFANGQLTQSLKSSVFRLSGSSNVVSLKQLQYSNTEGTENIQYYITTDAGTYYVYSDGSIDNDTGTFIVEGENANFIVEQENGMTTLCGLDLDKDKVIDDGQEGCNAGPELSEEEQSDSGF